MSEYYNSKRTRNLYDPSSKEPFKLSRSKIDLFLNCPRCFYLDRRLGVGQPPGYPFALNSAVDKLLKKEFDIFRAKGEPHPLITGNGVDARPVSHEELDKWRENFVGVQYFHEPTNFLITGAIDDLWINSAGEYIVVDYKSTSKDAETWKNSNKQLKILLHNMIFAENPTYSLNTGFGTPNLSLPFLLKQHIGGQNGDLVDPRGVEGASAVSINTLRLNSQQLTSVSCSLIERHRLSFWGSTPSQFVQ
ncbi:MAG: hypothetical protein ACOX0G_02030 [Patescibacteria group bacterium]|jgi:hypothetical protein